ncbi:MAG: nucleotidyltransferase family protein [Firmicutes bacterium]|nr:nucleotidyltransferase family protein [Bacillota bacterium]
MNKNRDYELQCILELLAVVVNNEPMPAWQREPDWGKLYKLAEYHHIANVLYGPIIPMDSKSVMRWKDSFEEQYHYAVTMQQRYRTSEDEIMKALERSKIHSMELEEMVINRCYKRKENRYPLPLTFLVEQGKSSALVVAMEAAGFEPKATKGKDPMPGEYRFHKVGGTEVVFYEKMDFTGKKINKYFSLPPQPFQTKKGSQYIHVQDINDFYLYYIAWLAERYARGSIEIRDILDLWQCYLLCYERLNWKEVNKELKRMDIDLFGEMIVKLAAMWFGYIEEFGDDLELLMDMEIYITSKGTKAREENQELLPLVKEVADVYARDLKKERRKRLLDMWFPERSYMETIYPILSKTAALLPACWAGRIIKKQYKKVKYTVLRQWVTIRQSLAQKTEKIRAKVKIVSKIRTWFKKRKQPGNNT